MRARVFVLQSPVPWEGWGCTGEACLPDLREGPSAASRAGSQEGDDVDDSDRLRGPAGTPFRVTDELPPRRKTGQSQKDILKSLHFPPIFLKGGSIKPGMERSMSVEDLVGNLWKMGRTSSEADFAKLFESFPSSGNLPSLLGGSSASLPGLDVAGASGGLRRSADGADEPSAASGPGPSGTAGGVMSMEGFMGE